MAVTTRSSSTRPTPHSAAPEPAASEPTVMPAPPKLRRRPVALLVSVATVVLGSLLGLWLWTSAGTTTQVLAARTLVHRGEVITPGDLVVVRVGLDPALRSVPASQENTVIGQRAALDLAPGGLLTPADITTTMVPARGFSVVGIGLAPGMLPSEPIVPGDAVRVVQTPGQQGQVTGTPVAIPATVVGVHPSATGDQTIVDVQVPSDAAADLAARAATGKVALVLDSSEK